MHHVKSRVELVGCDCSCNSLSNAQNTQETYIVFYFMLDVRSALRLSAIVDTSWCRIWQRGVTFTHLTDIRLQYLAVVSCACLSVRHQCANCISNTLAYFTSIVLFRPVHFASSPFYKQSSMSRDHSSSGDRLLLLLGSPTILVVQVEQLMHCNYNFRSQ